jgi:hypothetical protein
MTYRAVVGAMIYRVTSKNYALCGGEKLGTTGKREIDVQKHLIDFQRRQGELETRNVSPRWYLVMPNQAAVVSNLSRLYLGLQTLHRVSMGLA